MIIFLLKGLLRDRSRSLFPIITVSAGVMLMVLLHAWVTGILGESFRTTANFLTGHVKVMTRAFSENEDQLPNDLALLGVGEIMSDLRTGCPDMHWVSRIRFGGLLDIPDEKGETRAQGPAVGFGIDLFSQDSRDIQTLNIEKAVVKGRLPEKPGEILISDDFAQKLDVNPGEKGTLISSSMYGGLAMANFEIAGTVRFGISMMDRGAMIADVRDIQTALDMNDGASEILGFLPNDVYRNEKAVEVSEEFNALYAESGDEFDPVMVTLRNQMGLADYLDMASMFGSIMIFIFLLAMSLVLWNAGLLGGLRRYGEIGVRLAIGENKSQVYWSMVAESVMIGIVGSVSGTVIGLAFAYWLQVKGIDMGSMMKGSTMMITNIVRAKITTPAFYIGFIPGIFSTVLGSMLAGIGIYKRETAKLFKELEV
jgi:putative ABC transport system permease protein